LLAVAVIDAAQEPAPQFKSGVDLVEVYASVTDQAGKPVTGLTRDDFIVREDGEPQAIAAFVEGNFPLSIALAIDRSWSMAGEPLNRARRAAGVFLQALAPPDQSMLIAISGRVDTVAPLSTNREAATAALGRLDPWSTTALHDAIIQAADVIQAGTGRRALVLVSDGTDRYSTASADDVLAHVRRTDVMVYTATLAKREPPLFVELAAATGGRSFAARDGAALEDAMRSIVSDLHHQYLLGFAPDGKVREPGTWRSLEVTVKRTGARVRARRGYTANEASPIRQR